MSKLLKLQAALVSISGFQTVFPKAAHCSVKCLRGYLGVWGKSMARVQNSKDHVIVAYLIY